MIRKLRNKGTGEIGYLYANKDVNYQVLDENDCVLGVYDTLPRLIEEWEDYEGTKGCWIINVLGIVEYTHFRNKDEAEMLKEIGNRFETEKEAEKAVEKLKAITRLKGKGFRFTGYTNDSGDLFSCQVIRCSFDDFGKESREDLDLLFGGEE